MGCDLLVKWNGLWPVGGPNGLWPFYGWNGLGLLVDGMCFGLLMEWNGFWTHGGVEFVVVSFWGAMGCDLLVGWNGFSLWVRWKLRWNVFSLPAGWNGLDMLVRRIGCTVGRADWLTIGTAD